MTRLEDQLRQAEAEGFPEIVIPVEEARMALKAIQATKVPSEGLNAPALDCGALGSLLEAEEQVNG